MSKRVSTEIGKDVKGVISNLITIFKDEIDNKDACIVELFISRYNLFMRTMGIISVLDIISPIFTEYASSILDTNETNREKFFIETNVANVCNKHNVDNADINTVLDLTSLIRKCYISTNKTTKGIIYDEVKTLTSLCLEYELTKY